MKKFLPILPILLFFSSCSLLKVEQRAPASLKSATCFERMTHFEQVYSTKTNEELEAILKNAQESFGLKNVVVDSKGVLHQRFTDVPIEQGQSIKVYGRIFEEKGVPYFYYLKHSDDQILSKISASDLYEKGIESFKKSLSDGDFVMLPLVSKGEFFGHYYGAWKIIKSDNENVLLRHRKGSKVEVSWAQLFMENVVFSNDEKKFFSSFFLAGGRGEVFYYENDDIFDLPYAGAYIYVQKMPLYKNLNDEGKLLIGDVKTYNDLVELQKSKVSFVLTNERSNFLAAHTGNQTSFARSMVAKRSKLNKSGHLIFTPNADRAIIKHELRHYYDHKLGLHKEFFTKLEGLSGRGVIDEQGEATIKKFVLEQRAYATEIDFSTNPANFDSAHLKLFKTSSYEMELSEPLYYQSRSDQAHDTFRAVYSQALKAYLRSIGTTRARMIAHMIIPQCVESEVIDCSKILSEFLD